VHRAIGGKSERSFKEPILPGKCVAFFVMCANRTICLLHVLGTEANKCRRWQIWECFLLHSYGMICGLLERYVVVLFGASPVLNDAGWASGEGELEGGGGSEHALERGWVLCACVCVGEFASLVHTTMAALSRYAHTEIPHSCFTS